MEFDYFIRYRKSDSRTRNGIVRFIELFFYSRKIFRRYAPTRIAYRYFKHSRAVIWASTITLPP